MDETAQQRPSIESELLKEEVKQDSLKKRYFYKLFTSLFGLGINLVTQAIIPRGLGPKVYGDFSFLTNFFTQVVGFFDMGTSSAFYTKLSQRQKESTLVSFYLYFVSIILIGTIGLVFLVHTTSTNGKFWPEQKIFYVYLAAIWGILSWMVLVINSMADAYGLTVSAEIVRTLQKIFALILIVILYIFNQLNLTTFFYYHYLLFFFLGVAFIKVMKPNLMMLNWYLNREQIRRYIKEFYNYSYPLFMYSLMGLLVGLFDRWLLQIYGGSVQQGFYGLSYQIGAICFLFTGAMTPLLLREFSIAFGKKDISEMAGLFRRYVPMLYSVAAFFSCFIAVQGDKVVYLFGGNKFEEAALVVTIMAFYPLHQTYGQLSGSVFLATGQTRLYRNIGIILMLIGLPFTYFMIAPKASWGFGAGATGLAIKMVLLNFVWVNVQLYFNAKYLKISFSKYFVHQIVSVICLLTIAVFTTYLVNRPLGLDNHVFVSFIMAGMLYTLIVFFIVYYRPILFGLKKEDIQFLVRFFRDKLMLK